MGGDCSKIREVLATAVKDQCMSDVPFGLLLSGGLDSAVVATLLAPILKEMGKEFHTFSVGMPGSPDITAAKMVSEYFGTTHHEHAFQKELRRIFHHLHNVNCQRADRMTMAHGLEARVPFLDPNVIDTVMQVDPELKRIEGESKPEKHALRVLFDGEIPDPVLWRTKAMQCEGVGLNWVEDLQSFCEARVTDEEFARAGLEYAINPPQSKEELYYRKIFESHFREMDKFVHVWS